MYRVFALIISFSITLGLAFIAAGAAHAEDDAPLLTQPMKFGDAAMSCSQIVAEVGAMETMLGGNPSEALMDGEHLANVGTGLAQQAALSAGAGRAVGAIGQVGGLLGKSSKKKKEREAQQQAIAERRWLYMVGLYQGKSCDAELAAASAQ
ncbi:hypothetical protein [Hyphococcus sp.]|uniref:hypothetical protein n=1 Tax=Hyphococcus sp. TaxID=2038636 RepID=UPI003D0ED3E5